MEHAEGLDYLSGTGRKERVGFQRGPRSHTQPQTSRDPHAPQQRPDRARSASQSV